MNAAPRESRETAWRTFVRLRDEGFWPVAIRPPGEKIAFGRLSAGKEPIGKEWGLARWDLDRGRGIYQTKPGAGVGICLGPLRGPNGTWLIDVEGDGPEAEDSRNALFGGELFETLGWASTRGSHNLLIADVARLRAIMPGLNYLEDKGASRTGVYKIPELPDLELRIGGYKPDSSVKQVQSVVPPTPGTNGVPREWSGPAFPVHAPENFYLVLEGLASKKTPEPVVERRKTDSQSVRTVNGRWTPEARAVTYLDRCEPSVSGQRGHDKALKAAKVGPAFDLTPECTLRLLKDYWNHRCDPPWSDGELLHKVEEIYKITEDRGWLLKQDRPERLPPAPARPKLSVVGTEGPLSPEPKPEPLPPTDQELGLVCLDDVEEQQVTWLWQDRIPLGKITLIAGKGEIGKSFATLDIISRLTTGRPMPDGSNAGALPCDCIYVTAEDGIADTIKPRLRMAGADMKRVFTLGLARTPNGQTSVFTIADIDRLHTVVDRLPGVKLIAIDPISAFLGRVDENKNAELRALLTPLSEFAEARGVSITAITHFGKNPTTDASTKILGSVAYSNAARAVWCVVPDPIDPQRRLMLRVKNNLSANRTGMAYTIRDGRVEWEGEPIELSASEVLENSATEKRKGPEPVKSVKFTEWLWDRLQVGPERLHRIIDAARDDGLLPKPSASNSSPSRTPLYNARDRVPSLHPGWFVEEAEIEESNGKSYKHWRLAEKGD